MENNAVFRHEFKYPCSAAQLAILKSRLQNLLSLDRHAVGGEYRIRSLYFDTVDNRCFDENLAGIDPREKFRIRIYNADAAGIMLECKRKERGKTCKEVVPITREQFDRILQGGFLQRLGDLPALLRRFLLLQKTLLLRPAVIVEYDRTPFVYRDGNVRITLDRNLCSSQAFDRFFEKRLPVRPVLPAGQHLLEVKYDAFLPDFIKEALQTEELRQTAFSKYVLCRRFSNGGIL